MKYILVITGAAIVLTVVLLIVASLAYQADKDLKKKNAFEYCAETNGKLIYVGYTDSYNCEMK